MDIAREASRAQLNRDFESTGIDSSKGKPTKKSVSIMMTLQAQDKTAALTVPNSRLGAWTKVCDQLLCSGGRADYGELLRPVIAAKDSYQLAMFVVERTA